MVRLISFCLVITAVSCGTESKTYDYKSHPFDQQVIAKLPLYDSISQVLLKNFAALQDEMKEHSSFDYGFSNSMTLVNPKLPAEAVERIKQYQSELGDGLLSEFSVYKDSTIKYSIRDTELEGYDVTARERLSYLPNGGTMQRREPPNKDTVLNKNWQYWIRFDEKDIF